MTRYSALATQIMKEIIFEKEQYELEIFPKIDNSWTLFLDRDGVINKKLDNDYVKSLSEFKWLPDVPEAIVGLSKIFGKICIVTNQQGIGKGLMTTKQLDEIHHFLSNEIKRNGGNINAIYHAPQLAQENSEMRKPNIGMARQAKNDFPDIDFHKSIMVGDSLSDIEFGRRAGMTPILISDEDTNDVYSVESLIEFYNLLKSK